MRTLVVLAAVIVSSLGILGVPPVYAQTCVPAPAGLVGWWPGNGTTQDATAGNNGQLLGDATYAPGVVSQGFKLDGVGDGVEIPDSAALKPPHVSVEAWVRFDSLITPIVSQFGAVGQQYIIFKKNTRIFQFEGYALMKQRDGSGIDRLAFSVVNANGVGNVAVSATEVVVGLFYHVVGSYDGSALRVYVNGVLDATASTNVIMDYATRPVFIGTSGETVFDGKLDGIVDEASIYNRPLDATEVADLYAAGTAGKCSSATGLLTSLASFVQTLNLSQGISNSLDAKLQNVLQALDSASAGDSRSACGKLGAFMNEVNAQADKALTEAQAAQLTNLAQLVRAALACQ